MSSPSEAPEKTDSPVRNSRQVFGLIGGGTLAAAAVSAIAFMPPATYRRFESPTSTVREKVRAVCRYRDGRGEERDVFSTQCVMHGETSEPELQVLETTSSGIGGGVVSSLRIKDYHACTADLATAQAAAVGRFRTGVECTIERTVAEKE